MTSIATGIHDPLMTAVMFFALAVAGICLTIIAMFIYADRKAERSNEEGQDEARNCGFNLGRIAAASDIRQEINDLWATTEIPGGPEDAYNTCIEAIAKIDAYIYKISCGQYQDKGVNQ